MRSCEDRPRAEPCAPHRALELLFSRLRPSGSLLAAAHGQSAIGQRRALGRCTALLRRPRHIQVDGGAVVSVATRRARRHRVLVGARVVRRGGCRSARAACRGRAIRSTGSLRLVLLLARAAAAATAASTRVIDVATVLTRIGSVCRLRKRDRQREEDPNQKDNASHTSRRSAVQLTVK